MAQKWSKTVGFARRVWIHVFQFAKKGQN